jgi:hypothetical protein
MMGAAANTVGTRDAYRTLGGTVAARPAGPAPVA